MTRRQERVLVLGGGGVTGIAWMSGLCAGMAEHGWTVAGFDRVIGTSAGSVIGAQVCAGRWPQLMFQMQTETKLQVPEIKPKTPWLLIARHMVPILLAGRNETRRLQRIGAMALQARTTSWETRRAVIAARLGTDVWPDADFCCTVVDAVTGAFRTLDRTSGVNLIDAVAASCAVPGFWPVVDIDGRAYYDGGLRNAENADLAAGADEVVILSPMTRDRPGKMLAHHIATLREQGARVTLVKPDAASRLAMGKNSLDPSRRAPTAMAGRAQGASMR